MRTVKWKESSELAPPRVVGLTLDHYHCKQAGHFFEALWLKAGQM